MLIQIRCKDMNENMCATLIYCFHVLCFCCSKRQTMRRNIDNKPKRPDSLLKLHSAIMKPQKHPNELRKQKAAPIRQLISKSHLLSPPPFQTCLRLQSLLQTRGGWSAWRPVVWQMERCHRRRGASMAAAASGGEARDRDTATVRGVLAVISHCYAASVEYKLCSNAHVPTAPHAAALQHFLHSADSSGKCLPRV